MARAQGDTLSNRTAPPVLVPIAARRTRRRGQAEIGLTLEEPSLAVLSWLDRY